MCAAYCEQVRSGVTLRSLLSFTSGLLIDPISIYVCDGGFESCAERAYKVPPTVVRCYPWL